jgi:hypothetical protein
MNKINIAGHGPDDWIYYKKIHRGKYKYELIRMTWAKMPDGIRQFVSRPVGNDFVVIDANGWMHISSGYAWDGPSGPTIDTKNFMRGSLFHDALYQLMREGMLPQEARLAADRLLRVHCREDGMSAVRAWWVFWGVRIGGASSARLKTISPLD